MAYWEQDIAEIILTEEQIAQRVGQLAEQISADYQDCELVLVGILTGSFVFLADLMRQLTRPCQIDFFDVSSYGDDTTSSGDVAILKDLGLPVIGKHVLMVEDIVDSGRTVAKLVEVVKDRQPASVKVCTLLSKTARRELAVELNYIGFEIPNYFVVGYGLDYAQRFRSLPFVAVLKDDAIPNPP